MEDKYGGMPSESGLRHRSAGREVAYEQALGQEPLLSKSSRN